MSSLLSTVHKQILAFRLRDLIATSPLLLIYQTLGGKVRGTQLEASLRAGLNKALPDGHSIRPQSFKVKNTVAAAVGDGTLETLFHASNILIGWQLPMPPPNSTPANSPLGAATPATHTGSTSKGPADDQTSTSKPGIGLSPGGSLSASSRTRRELTLQQMLDGAAELAAAQSARWPSHSTLSHLLRLGMRLPDEHPIALLACLHRGRPVRLSQLERWAQLDESATFSDLLAQLETPALSLLGNMEVPSEQLAATLGSTGAADLLDCLDAHHHQQQQQQQTQQQQV